MSPESQNHADILRAMSLEWRAHDDLSEAMLELALRVQAARSNEEGDQ